MIRKIKDTILTTTPFSRKVSTFNRKVPTFNRKVSPVSRKASSLADKRSLITVSYIPRKQQKQAKTSKTTTLELN